MDLYGVTWRKSRYSDQQGNCVEVGVWRKSSRSAQEGNCVEVAGNLAGVVMVRDSKEPDGPMLVFSPQAWNAFARRAKRGGAVLG